MASQKGSQSMYDSRQSRRSVNRTKLSHEVSRFKERLKSDYCTLAIRALCLLAKYRLHSRVARLILELLHQPDLAQAIELLEIVPELVEKRRSEKKYML